MVEDRNWCHVVFEIGVRIRVRVLLLEGDVVVELGEVLAKRVELLVEVLRQLLAPNLVRTAVDDQPAQVLPPLLLIEVRPHLFVHDSACAAVVERANAHAVGQISIALLYFKIAVLVVILLLVLAI